MTDMVEVMFCCDMGENSTSCAAVDFRTSTNLMSYKGGGNLQQRTMNVLRNEFVVAANSTKPLLHVWPINAQEQISAVRFVVPGRVNALAISMDGIYLVAGIQETIYIWHVTTGRMLNTISKHYQTINCIRFTNDGSHFVSAGQDGGVLVWNLTRLVSRGEQNQLPLYSFTDHGLPVTDVWVGAGGMRAYMFTVSLDRTCKIYDLSSGKLLLSVVFAEGLQSVTTDALETSVYVGTCDGNIYEFHTDAAPRTKEYHLEKDQSMSFVGHKKGTAVNCLSLSIDGHTLVSGGADGQICVWDVPSRQLLRTLIQKGVVTNLSLSLCSTTIFHPEHKQPRVFGENLRRMLDPPEADEDQVIEVLVTEQQQFGDIAPNSIFGVAATTSEPNNGTVHTSNDELEKLRAEVAHLKSVNRQLFEISTKQLLRNPKRKKNN